MSVTTAQVRILCRQFEGLLCPICGDEKKRANCFCKRCYFALKAARPNLAAGLWSDVFAENNHFFESYLKSKEFLATTGLNKLKHERKGGLFA